MKNLGLVFEYGFHDKKKFLASGFIEKLKEKFNIVIVIPKSKKTKIIPILKEYNLKYIEIDYSKSEKIFIKVIKRKLSHNIMMAKGDSPFHNHKKLSFQNPSKTNVFFSKLILNYILKIEYLFSKFINSISKNLYDFNLDILLTTSCSPFSLSLYYDSIHKKNIDFYYLINSWKDIYIDPIIPYQRLKAIFVWDNNMKEKYLTYNNTSESKYFVSGNPTMDVYHNYRPNFDKTYYAKKYAINFKNKIILLSMMPKGDIIDEPEIDRLTFIIKSIRRKFKNFNFVIKLNPTHSKDEFVDYKLPNHTVFLEHYVYFDEINDLIIQDEIGEKEWTDIVYYSYLNISVPSTVSLEFLVNRKHVINYSFNSKNQIDSNLNQFIYAPYYKPLYENQFIHLCNNVNDIIHKINSLEESDTSISNNNDESSAKKIIKILSQ